MYQTITMTSIPDVFNLAPALSWARPASGGRAFAGPAPDFLTPDGHLVPRAIGEAALRESKAILIGDLLVLGTPADASGSRSSW